jgi:transcription initiation protein SPT3
VRPTNQLIRARALTVLRASRYLTSDDLLFLIRQDKFKVARLKNYLAWKDVRKRVKQDQESKGDDVNVEEELGAGDETAGKQRSFFTPSLAHRGAEYEGKLLVDTDKKPVKQVVKLPWELLTPFTEFLRTLPVALGTSAAGADDDDDDEEELEAYEESLQRLRVSLGKASTVLPRGTAI